MVSRLSSTRNPGGYRCDRFLANSINSSIAASNAAPASGSCGSGFAGANSANTYCSTDNCRAAAWALNSALVSSGMVRWTMGVSSESGYPAIGNSTRVANSVQFSWNSNAYAHNGHRGTATELGRDRPRPSGLERSARPPLCPEDAGETALRQKAMRWQPNLIRVRNLPRSSHRKISLKYSACSEPHEDPNANPRNG